MNHAIRVVDVRHLHTPEERVGVLYVGRTFAGWRGHPLRNRFRALVPKPETTATEELAELTEKAIADCLECYKADIATRSTLEADLAALWIQTEQGRKPLGCWCVNAYAGDGSPIVCHAQILAEMLRERFHSVTEPTGRAG